MSLETTIPPGAAQARVPARPLQAIRTIARKELAGFFASPAAYLFVGAFLAATLFVVFWVETFFARGLADVRPMFQWMPVLLIFLVAALTMRSWAEERRAGTIELLLTAPVTPAELVLGKFAGAFALVAIALLLTLPLPLSVALLGPLDWGPVVGGYVAALALAAAYVAIGLAVSARTDNQIVSLIATVLVAGAFYLAGSPVLTALAGGRLGELMRAIGAGSRFESIARGVLDLRDLAYYLSLTGVFLIVNRLALERLRWAGGDAQRARHRRWLWAAGLAVANLLALNLWLDPLTGARVDLTAGGLYSLSDATRDELRALPEPLVIRGYFSSSTHPLLAPLVPQLRDLLREYAVAGGARVQVEFVDPHDDRAVETEANERYDIRPTPFQVASKYQASVVNAYFDILVKYGDETQALGLHDLIAVKERSESDFEVTLKNPEYELTRAIRKVKASYQGGGNVWAALARPLVVTAYVSPDDALPAELVQARHALDAALAALRAQAGQRLQVKVADPGRDAALAQRLEREQGMRPLVAGLLDTRPFWFYLVLGDGTRSDALPLPERLDEAGFRRAIEAAAKRFSPGFLKTVAVLAPPAPPPGLGMPPSGQSFERLREALGDAVRWEEADLRDGRVPADADLLVVLAPEALDLKQRFAIDQYLMQGGGVVVATAPVDVEIGRTLQARPVTSGLEDWLGHFGITLTRGLVLDPQSGALPIPVERPLGNGLSVREIQLVPYPYIVEVRGDGFAPGQPVTAGMSALDVPWTAAIDVDAKAVAGLRVTPLLRSSAASWVDAAAPLVPDYATHPELGFAPTGTRGPRTLAVQLAGRFTSAFAGQRSPLLPPAGAASAPAAAASAPAAPDAAALGRVIDHSPPDAKLVVVASNALWGDRANALLGQARGTRDLRPAQFAQNLVDALLDDTGLIAIRSRGGYARTLAPLSREEQSAWEYGNYAAAAIGLAVVAGWRRAQRRRRTRRQALILQEAWCAAPP